MEPQPLTNRATPSLTLASSTRRRQLLLYPFTCTNECNAGDVTEERRPRQPESVFWMSWGDVRRHFARASLFQAFVAFFKMCKKTCDSSVIVMYRHWQSVQHWRERTKYPSPTRLRVFRYLSSWTPFCVQSLSLRVALWLAGSWTCLVALWGTWDDISVCLAATCWTQINVT